MPNSSAGTLKNVTVGVNQDCTIAQEFLKNMDAEDFDGKLTAEFQKLSSDQRFEFVRLLMERDENRVSA